MTSLERSVSDHDSGENLRHSRRIGDDVASCRAGPAQRSARRPRNLREQLDETMDEVTAPEGRS